MADRTGNFYKDIRTIKPQTTKKEHRGYSVTFDFVPPKKGEQKEMFTLAFGNTEARALLNSGWSFEFSRKAPDLPLISLMSLGNEKHLYGIGVVCSSSSNEEPPMIVIPILGKDRKELNCADIYKIQFDTFKQVFHPTHEEFRSGTLCRIDSVREYHCKKKPVYGVAFIHPNEEKAQYSKATGHSVSFGNALRKLTKNKKIREHLWKAFWLEYPECDTRKDEIPFNE